MAHDSFEMGKPEADTPQLPGRRRWLRRAAAGVALVSTPLAYGHWWEAEHLRVTRVDLRLPGWPSAASGFRVGILSDPHCDSIHEADRAARAARLLLRERPDAIFLTGDYTTHWPHPWSERAADALAPLGQLKDRVYAILGNHDWSGRDPGGVSRNLAAAGVRMLRNGAAPLRGPGGLVQGVEVVGLDPRSNRRQDPVRATRGLMASSLKILLVHEPDYADESPEGFAVQFSGHSHGGQIRLPGIGAIHTPAHARKYVDGLCHGRRHPVYVSRGVGMVGPKVRINCPPEVNLIRIYPA